MLGVCTAVGMSPRRQSVFLRVTALFRCLGDLDFSAPTIVLPGRPRLFRRVASPILGAELLGVDNCGQLSFKAAGPWPQVWSWPLVWCHFTYP